MARHDNSHVTLDLEPGADPIRGMIASGDGSSRRFWGWLELMEELRRVAAGDDPTRPPSPPHPAEAEAQKEPGTFHSSHGDQPMHRFVPRFVSLVSLAVVALVALSACGASTAPSGSAVTQKTAAAAAAAGASVRAELAPSGRLRVGIPADPPFFGVKDPGTGALRGIGVDLATALGQQLGVPVTTVSYPDFGGAISASQTGAWDVSVLPVNPQATAVASLTAPFLLVPHSYLVRADSSLRTVADADQPGVRIASEATAPHTAALAGQLTHAQVVKVDSKDAGVNLLMTGQVDAFAAARPALDAVAAHVPGSRIVAGDFFVVRVALAVPLGHAAGQAFLARFIESEKASGFVQRAIDRLGTPDISVAPAAS